MDSNYDEISQQQLDVFKERGYDNEDILPKTGAQRDTGRGNFFTLWMGNIHNIPNYAAVGGFLFLGLSPLNVMFALVLSGLAVALFMIFNGVAGSKHGIPFAMHLRATYGNAGAKLPGFIRGVIVAIAWFGLQTYTGSQAMLIIIGQIWPGFLEIGGNIPVLNIGVPSLIAFLVFWVFNMAIGFGGGKVLNKFTGILTPLIYVVFIAATIWAINVAGLGNILAFQPAEVSGTINPLVIYFMIINSVLAVWAAPGASVADFTQNAKSTKAQMVGQTASLFVGYIVFAITSVTILIGGTLYYDAPAWDVLQVINNWESLPAIAIAGGVLLLTTISTNATANIIPAGYQLAALVPSKISYRTGVIIAGVVSILIMPWRLMENPDNLYFFLNTIGALLGPVAGVMIVHYFYVLKQQVDLDQLYFDPKSNQRSIYRGTNIPAYIATFVGFILSIIGQFIPGLSFLAEIGWIAGFVGAVLTYWLLVLFTDNKKLTGVK